MSGPRLKTHSPSPSTTCFTVSNAPLLDSGFAQGLRFLSLALRAVIAVASAAVLFLQGRQAMRALNQLSAQTTWELEEAWAASVSGILGPEFTAGGRYWWVSSVACALAIWIAIRRNYAEESLLVIRGLGIQTSSSSPWYLSAATTRFIPTSQVQDIFIHEAFLGFEVRFYLAAIIEGDEQAVVVFPRLLPRRNVLEEVWRGSRAVLAWGKDSD